MSQHTQEPWTVNHHAVKGPSLDNEDSSIELARFGSSFNAQRAADCINGCAGLNPQAFRECVEALKAIKARLEADSPDDIDNEEAVYLIASQAITHAQNE